VRLVVFLTTLSWSPCVTFNFWSMEGLGGKYNQRNKDWRRWSSVEPSWEPQLDCPSSVQTSLCSPMLFKTVWAPCCPEGLWKQGCCRYWKSRNR
jgi:hypothetical protein